MLATEGKTPQNRVDVIENNKTSISAISKREVSSRAIVQRIKKCQYYSYIPKIITDFKE